MTEATIQALRDALAKRSLSGVWLLHDLAQFERAAIDAAPAMLAEVDLQQARSAQLLEAEHAMSGAYVRLRMILGAMDPPDRCTAQELWAYVEGKASGLASEVERLTAELAAARVDAERLRGIGGQLANVAFNWSQGACAAGQKLTDTERSMLKSLQRQWDDAARTT